MKKKIILLVFIVFSYNVYSQKIDFKHTATIGVGKSLVGILLKTVEKTYNIVSNQKTVNYYSKPSLGITYEYKINEMISIGGALSRESAGLIFTNHIFAEDVANVEYNFNAELLRWNTSVRALVHYGNLEKIDMISGVRFGLTSYKFNLVSEDEIPYFDIEKDLDLASGLSPSYQVIIFGIRAFVTNNIGIAIEFSVGTPYFAFGGLTFRI